MFSLKDRLGERVEAAFQSIGLDASFGAVKAADRPDLADFQCNGALAAAKTVQRNPREIAAAVVDVLQKDPAFTKAEVAGPGFINLLVSTDVLSSAILEICRDPNGGGWRAPDREKIVLDYGGPNVAKPLHVGHLRSAIIGEALKRILRSAGHEVVGDIHLGDWGLQMGQLISELERRMPALPYFSSSEGPFPSAPPISLADLEELYPAASAACKADPARADEARKATKALQGGRAGYRALWRHFVALSVAAMKTNYADLEVGFDLWQGEGDVDPLIPELIDDLKSKQVLEPSDGAWIIRVAREDDRKTVPPIIFINSEGAVGYHATDIATIVDRARSLAPHRILYVVDGRQQLHFEQVFRAADRAGYFPENRLEHLWFGTMNGKDGKPFKTRAGGVLKLRDLIDMVKERAGDRLREGGLAEDMNAQERDEVARMVGVAALKFADLANPRTTDYVFDLDRFMSFEGKTGPYLLYAFVRIRSLLEKADRLAGLDDPNPDAIELSGAFSDPACRELALALASFADAMEGAVRRRSPHLLCDHAFRLAQAFSKFYAACRILDEAEVELREARIVMSAVAGRQLKLALEMLGIATPHRM
ncbi:MAG: arginine--tRNA ligase [Alphaproteobacteria bacterium]|nr:arginine--tRNA ligase [Alphaproteobacteria bacterium]